MYFGGYVMIETPLQINLERRHHHQERMCTAAGSTPAQDVPSAALPPNPPAIMTATPACRFWRGGSYASQLVEGARVTNGSSPAFSPPP